MSKISQIRGKQMSREFLLEFCENGMDSHTNQMYKALFDQDWEFLKEISMNYERDCYNIGAIEIVGKLIKLRLLLQDEPVEHIIIERTFNNIVEQSAKVQEFLINYLKNSEGALVLHGIHYITKQSNSNLEYRQTWYYKNCIIQ